MKKVLIVLGVLCLGCIVGVVGLLIWGKQSGANLQEEFFKAVASGDPSQVSAQFHPALREKIDEPALGAWMTAFNGAMGEFQGLNTNGFSHNVSYEDGVKVTTSSGTVRFSKGEAKSELIYNDGQIVSFHVNTPTLGDDWMKNLADVDPYLMRGQEFLRCFLDAETEKAYEMMDSSLQLSVSRVRLQEMIENITGGAGPMQSIAYRDHTIDAVDNKGLMTIRYDVVCSNKSLDGTVEFRFEGFKSRLVAFRLQEKQ